MAVLQKHPPWPFCLDEDFEMQTTRIRSAPPLFSLYLSWSPPDNESLLRPKANTVRIRLEFHVEGLVVVVAVLFRRARLCGQLRVGLNHDAAVAVFAVPAPATEHCDE